VFALRHPDHRLTASFAAIADALTTDGPGMARGPRGDPPAAPDDGGPGDGTFRR
jgi:hypothetical protein